MGVASNPSGRARYYVISTRTSRHWYAGIQGRRVPTGSPLLNRGWRVSRVARASIKGLEALGDEKYILCPEARAVSSLVDITFHPASGVPTIITISLLNTLRVCLLSLPILA